LINHLKSSPVFHPDLTFLAAYDNGKLSLIWAILLVLPEAICCLEAKYSVAKTVDFGLKLVDSCHAIYSSIATSIGYEALG
jgi:mannosyl-oligosaccharide alpha-1,2-mannosidase